MAAKHWRYSGYQLTLLTLSYVCGELGHFILGVTSREMANDIHYGDQGCVTFNHTLNLSDVVCETVKDQASCDELGSQCGWIYTGLGMEYQILAGPAFVAVFTVSGVILGGMADVFSRTKLLGGSVVIFSLALFGMGLAEQYWHLVLFRMTLAAGEAACTPISISLISDLFPPELRGTASGIFHWGVYIGYGLSYAVGVYVTQANVLGLGWRACYYLSGIPGIVLGIMLASLTDVRETTRSHDMHRRYSDVKQTDEEGDPLSSKVSIPTPDVAEQKSEGKSRLGLIATSFCQPVVILLFMAAALRHSAGFSFAYNARLYFLTYYPSFDVGPWLSWIPIVGGTVGVVAGGFVSDKIVYKLGMAARLLVLGGAMLIAAPFALGVLLCQPPVSFGLLIPYYLFSETWLGIVFVVVVEIVNPEVKTSILGIFLFLMNNVGGNCPILVDPISKAIGYREALYIFFPSCVAASGIVFLISSVPLLMKR